MECPRCHLPIFESGWGTYFCDFCKIEIFLADDEDEDDYDYDPSRVESPEIFCDWDDDDEGHPDRHQEDEIE